MSPRWLGVIAVLSLATGFALILYGISQDFG